MATVRYVVRDVGASIDFYAGLLGFTLVERYGAAMAILERDGLKLWIAGPLASASRPLPDGRQPAPGGWSRFVLEVADLRQVMEALSQRGVTFVQSIIEGPGGRQTLCEDPSGNVIELFEARRAE
jgi:catechol 2,3-dioxygenase-like lactoylglutathione lyase family enzyme